MKPRKHIDTDTVTEKMLQWPDSGQTTRLTRPRKDALPPEPGWDPNQNHEDSWNGSDGPECEGGGVGTFTPGGAATLESGPAAPVMFKQNIRGPQRLHPQAYGRPKRQHMSKHLCAGAWKGWEGDG